MSHMCLTSRPVLERIWTGVDRAVRAVPPLWPLSSSVAVNPFLGQAGEGLAEAGARLARVAGLRVTMPRRWYRERICSGAISDEDLRQAWEKADEGRRPPDIDAVKAGAARDDSPPEALPTIADLAARVSGLDWPGLIADRIGAFCAGYFDEGQALWPLPRGKTAFASWRAEAMHDLTPEIAGLSGFATHVSGTPEEALSAIARAVERLGLGDDSLETYFHQLLSTLGGWGQYARYKLWQAELAGGSDQTACDLLAIRLVWEEALFARYESKIAGDWAEVRDRHAMPLSPGPELILDVILQNAAEVASQRSLAADFARETSGRGQDRPALQAVFCIDVRSEVFRRALESVDPGIETLGSAGFFGVATAHRRAASDLKEHRLPALLVPAVASRAGAPGTDERLRVLARAGRAWGRFKLAAVSSFAFVEASGPIYVGKLIADAFGIGHLPQPPDPAPRLDPDPGPEEKTETAERVLRAMSFTEGFARLVVLVGHGAGVVNNPHASALHCGACGGYSGEVNARLLASVLNDGDVRSGLRRRGIEIPSDVLFIGALHDTTSDQVTLFPDDRPSPGHTADLDRAGVWLAAAGRIARGERARTFPRAVKAAGLARRGRNWAQTRPEWGLAGCRAFIVAPRSRTAGRILDGRAFLHDYDWRRDPDFTGLELILTAPVVVASWISLQYYGSTVAPELFGGGNKLLHNVTGGIGVLEGGGGLLRSGLPRQSIHDGVRHRHDPLRLTVCIEAPRDAIVAILRRHPAIRTLFDFGWMSLLAFDDRGRLAWRYAGELTWEEIPGRTDRPVCASATVLP